MTVRASQIMNAGFLGSVIPHTGEPLPSEGACGEASCSFSGSFARAVLVAFFVRFLAETGLSPDGDAARLRFLVCGVSASAAAVLFVESLWVLVWGVSLEVGREGFTFRIRRCRFASVEPKLDLEVAP